MVARYWSGGLLQTALPSLIVTRPVTCVDFGSLEGQAGSLIREALCSHEQSRLIYVDPCDGTEAEQCGAAYAAGAVLRDLPDASVYFGFIDGQSSVAKARGDAEKLLPKMEGGGYILFGNERREGVAGPENEHAVVEAFCRDFSLRRIGGSLVQVVREPAAVDFDLYVVVWNEERMIAHTLSHYRQARRIYLLDSGSTDRTLEVARGVRSDVVVVPYDTGNTFDDFINRTLKESVWKGSDADYVVVVDCDELLHFPLFPNDISGGLLQLKRCGATVHKSRGVAMFSTDEDFAQVRPGQYLSTALLKGALDPSRFYNKTVCFDPRSILEIGYDLGAHNAYPSGRVVVAPDVLSLLLHYKYTGINYTLARCAINRLRFSDANLHAKAGVQNYLSHEEILDIYHEGLMGDASKLMFPGDSLAPFRLGGRSCVMCLEHCHTDYISQTLRNGHVWKPRVTAVLEDLVGRWDRVSFVDVGAYVGAHVCAAQLAGVHEVFAFECYQPTFQMLQCTVAINGWRNVRLYDLAASDETHERVKFSCVEGNQGANYIDETHNLESCLQGSFSGSYVRTGRVDDVIRMEDVDSNNIVVKIDVEGHERKALLGLSCILGSNKTRAVLIELNPNCSPVAELLGNLEILGAHGFAEWRLIYATTEHPWAGHRIADPAGFASQCCVVSARDLAHFFDVHPMDVIEVLALPLA